MRTAATSPVRVMVMSFRIWSRLSSSDCDVSSLSLEFVYPYSSRSGPVVALPDDDKVRRRRRLLDSLDSYPEFIQLKPKGGGGSMPLVKSMDLQSSFCAAGIESIDPSSDSDRAEIMTSMTAPPSTPEVAESVTDP